MSKISVIIPAYNAGAFIENCIESVLKQSFQDFEIIVVNDGSKDNTLEILNRLAEKDNRIQVHSQKNGGVSAARNTALKYATGEFITYVDADDSVPENGFENMMSLMEDGVDMVVCSHNEVRIGMRPHLEKPNVLNGADDIASRFPEYDRVVWWPWGKLLRRSIIADNNLQYDTNITFGEDHIFNLLFAKYITGKVIVSDKIAYNYHYIRGGLCSKYYSNMDELQKYVYIKIADYFGGLDCIPREHQEHYAGCYLKGCVEYYLAWLSKKDADKKMPECFKVYEDIIDEDILKIYFTEKQVELIKSGSFKEFNTDYIKSNPKATLWRKVRRSVRMFLEAMQKVFLKRA